MANMEAMLRRMAQLGASDLHLSTGNPARIRLHGDIQLLAGEAKITADEMMDLIGQVAPARNLAQFEDHNDADFAYELGGVGRFRVNIFQHRKGPGAVLRLIPFEVTPLEELGVPPVLVDFCGLSKGMVLVTGPTGSGKSTTLAAMVDEINNRRRDHIITIEDPIEFVHESRSCLVHQRETGVHTGSFKKALRAALREDPDVVLVGEMRDLETMAIAIETAETGHLVFATLHTTTAASTVDRLIDQFPAGQQQQIRTMLSTSLKGVVAQTLLKRRDGKGRVAAFEVLVVTPAVANLIRDGKTYQLPSAMQTGGKYGMQQLNNHLVELVDRNVVSPDEAYLKAIDKTDLLNRYRQRDIRYTPRGIEEATDDAVQAASPSRVDRFKAYEEMRPSARLRKTAAQNLAEPPPERKSARKGQSLYGGQTVGFETWVQRSKEDRK